jgi:hypothetical protein
MGYSVSRVNTSTKEHWWLMTPGERFISAMATCSVTYRCAVRSISIDLRGEHLTPWQWSEQSVALPAMVISWKKLNMAEAR